jgi:outer membrane immunogenic protein
LLFLKMGAIMKKLLQSSTAFLVLAGALAFAQGPALASPDDLDREKAQLRKENADLRDLLRMHDENKALRKRLGEKGIEAPAPRAVAEPPRLQPPSGEAVRAEAAPRRVAPSVFESYAADMPVKAAPPVRVAIYDWTGFYVGGNIGYSIGNDRTNTSLFDPAAGSTTLPFTDFVVAPRGVLGGVQVGYNWQAGRNWLAGFEADIQAANQTDRGCTINCINQGGGQINTFTTEQKLQYFGTLRGRLGIVSDNVLFYGTGGAAFGHVRETVTISQQSVNGGNLATGAFSDTLFGWVAGGGIEAALSGNWTGRIPLHGSRGHEAQRS